MAKQTSKPKVAQTEDASTTAIVSTLSQGQASRSKLDALVVLLQRDEGAQLGELMVATGWQAHSVRGAIAGSLKKKRGLLVTSEKSEAGRIYRIVAPAA